MTHAELDEACEGDGVGAEPRRGEVREQRERGGERPLDAESGECGEERVGVGVQAAVAAPVSGGKAAAGETFEQGTHWMANGLPATASGNESKLEYESHRV